jgi:hypothetical protein
MTCISGTKIAIVAIESCGMNGTGSTFTSIGAVTNITIIATGFIWDHRMNIAVARRTIKITTCLYARVE